MFEKQQEKEAGQRNTKLVLICIFTFVLKPYDYTWSCWRKFPLVITYSKKLKANSYNSYHETNSLNESSFVQLSLSPRNRFVGSG